MTKRAKIAVPLLTYEHHQRRGGQVSNGVLVIEDRENGKLIFGVVGDIGSKCAASRAAYQPEREMVALDFGLSTLFVANDGALLGRGWLALRGHDRCISEVARGHQRHGRKPRDSARCRSAVTALRSWIRTQRADGVLHPIRWEGFHRRPEIDQCLLRWGTEDFGPDVESEAATKFGSC